MLHSLIDALPDFVCFKDVAGRWRLANRAARQLFALDALDWSGKTDEELAAVADARTAAWLRQCAEAEQAAWQEGGGVLREETLAHPAAGTAVFEVLRVPLFHGDGSRRGLLVHGRDVSAQKSAERRAASRSAILDALISCDWLLLTTENWRKVAPAVLELLGVAPGYDRVGLYANVSPAAGGLAAECLCHWVSPRCAAPPVPRLDYEAAGYRRWREQLRGGRPVFGVLADLPQPEQALLQQQGVTALIAVPIAVGEDWWGMLTVERCSAVEEISPQELGAVMAAGRSFGAAIQREIALERLQQAMVAFDSAAEGIMVTDADARIVAINQGFTDITGYSEAEVVGQTPRVLRSGRHDDAFYKEMCLQIESQGRWQGEIWNRRKNGEIFPEWLTINVVRDADGNIFRQVAVFSDISESKHAEDRLNSLVNRDPLTGLPNRRLLIELMGHALRRAEREGGMVAVLFVDLDRFKAVNDTLGHLVGDKLLLEVTRRLTGAIRDSDTVARLGGDEFLIMMDGINDRDDAALVAKKLLLSLQSAFHIDNRELYVGASIGISLYPDDAGSVDELIKMADIAMYQVKNSGKNNYCYYSHDFSRDAVERFTLDVELRHALERGQFELYYQPRVSLRSGRVIGAEALVRWHHPELGVVSPAKFIPLAEETGLIVQIGEWVLREAARQVMDWVTQGFLIESVSVNVSGVQIQRSHFADTVYGVLLETQCREGLLELEITESTVMYNTEHVSGVLDSIRQLGVLLAIDDFGTGYSSLSHLKRLPLDKLKIDQSFVRDLPHDEEDAVITRAIHALGHNLGLAVVAEGVESEQQHAFLRDIGCDEAQGYHYGRPVPAGEFTALLQENGALRA